MLNLIGVIVAFIAMIILIRKKFNFGLSIIIGALIVGFFSLQTIELIDIPKAIIEASIYSFEEQQIYTETLELAILMTMIFVLYIVLMVINTQYHYILRKLMFLK